jgi:hypothetical protein
MRTARALVTADGAYRLVAGRAAAVVRDRAERSGGPAGGGLLAGAYLAVAALRWAYRALWWRGRGLVVLSAGPHRRWTWQTADAATARAAATALADLVTTGRWVPGSSPAPPLPGATLLRDRGAPRDGPPAADPDCGPATTLDG